MRCAGPYTRVFLDRKDSKACRRLVERLTAAGFRIDQAKVPAGGGGLDDFSCDITLRGPNDAATTWQLSLARFLGPKRLIGRGRVYELTLRRTTDAWRGHLFATHPGALFDRLLADWPRLTAGDPDTGLVPAADAHERRIELCVGL